VIRSVRTFSWFTSDLDRYPASLPYADQALSSHFFTLPSFSFLKFFSVLKYIHVPYRCGRYQTVSEKIEIRTSVIVLIFVDFVGTGSGRIANADPDP